MKAMSKSGPENGNDFESGIGVERVVELELKQELYLEMKQELYLEMKAGNESMLVQEQPAPSFKALRRLVVNPDDPLPAGPVGVDYGVLENGLCYYVRKNAKPKERAALALGVRIG